MIKMIIQILAALPEIVKLLQAIQSQVDDRMREKTLKKKVKEIEQAFKEKDEKALRDIFNGNAE